MATALVTIDGCFVVGATDKALKVVTGKGQEVWVPRSQLRDADESDIHDDSSEGDEGEMILPEWLAQEKELI